MGQRLRIGCGVKALQTEIDYFTTWNPALAERAYFTSLGLGLIAFHHFGVVRIYEHQFAGFKSRWTSPCFSAAARAEVTCCAIPMVLTAH